MNLRRLALRALMDITDGGAYANLRLKQAARGLSARDAKWLYAAVYGTLDHLLYIDYVLAQLAKGRQKPVIRGILRLGAQELLYMRVPAPAACNEAVKLAQELGKDALSGYVNGVLRTLARRIDDLPPLPELPALRLSIQYSWPQWLVDAWIARFGQQETEALLQAYEGRQGMALRAQPPYTVEQLKAELDKRGIPYTPGALLQDCLRLRTGLPIADDPLFQAGQCTVQSEGAMLSCLACGIKPGMRVLDACAAPGGKSAYLYALAGGDIQLCAWELHPHRKELLDKTLQRLHVPAQTCLRDATQHAQAPEEYFDVVLLDVPCSGLGVAGGKPDIRYAKSPEAISELAHIQRRMLAACAGYVRVGGILLYTSCTISEQENELQIAEFLKAHDEFLPEDLSPYMPQSLPGLEQGRIQLLPHKHKTEGFFIARLRKVKQPCKNH